MVNQLKSVAAVSNAKEAKKLGHRAIVSSDKLETNDSKVQIVHIKFNHPDEMMEGDLLGPLSTGKYLLRIMLKNKKGKETLAKAHVELNLTEEQALEMIAKNEFYNDLTLLKLCAFTGYKAEKKVLDLAESGELLTKMSLKTRHGVAKSFQEALYDVKKAKDGSINLSDIKIKEDSVFQLQNQSNHGVDLVLEVEPFPPDPQYLSVDVKGVMKESFGPRATPKGPGLSDYQEEPYDNLMKHLDESLKSYKDEINAYSLTESQVDKFNIIRKNLEYDKASLLSIRIDVGMKGGFEVPKNDKYPNGLIVASYIKQYEN